LASKSTAISPAAAKDGLALHQGASLDEVERREERKDDRTHPPGKDLVLQKEGGQNHPNEIGGQHCFAFGDRSQPSEQEQHEQDELDLRFACPVADLLEEPGHESRQQEHNDGSNYPEERQPHIVVCEEDAERDHRAEVVHEARGKDDLAHLRAVEARFDHHRVDHGDGRRRKGDACDQRLLPGP